MSLSTRLPPELWCAIWDDALALKDRVAVSHVCRYWRDVAVHCASLWEHLEFSSTVHGEDCTCEHCGTWQQSVLAGDGAPTRVFVCNPGPRPGRTNMPLILSLVPRSGSIPLYLSFDVYPYVTDLSLIEDFGIQLAASGASDRIISISAIFEDTRALRYLMRGIKRFPALESLIAERQFDPSTTIKHLCFIGLMGDAAGAVGSHANVSHSGLHVASETARSSWARWSRRPARHETDRLVATYIARRNDLSHPIPCARSALPVLAAHVSRSQRTPFSFVVRCAPRSRLRLIMPQSADTLEHVAAAKTRIPRQVWTMDQLRYERDVALGFALEAGSRLAYSSHLKSYVGFCRRHGLSYEATPDTLSLYVAYESHFIDARSVKSYLSGVCSSLEPIFPHVRNARASPLVKNTIAGRLKMTRSSVSRKSPLSADDVERIITKYRGGSHDDVLFACLLAVGFNGLHRLGELVWPDTKALQSSRKSISFASLVLKDDHCSYDLPGHKGNRFFEGNRVAIYSHADGADALPILRLYLNHRASHTDTYLRPQLFVRGDGSVPTRSWFLRYLSADFAKDVAGHSVRSGGATDLALRGIPDHIIQKAGRWTSDTFQIYIRKNPALLAALAGFAQPSGPTAGATRSNP